ncbi:hypothetical protein ACFRCR_07745 [Oerskovia sp. NPDC056781]|uniref:hypothetical protein n=1 Tax=Oerskovia sp. NPDC056781 TaxID=3345942 RepID=UPI00366E01DC
MNSRKARFVLVTTSLALTTSLLAACGGGDVPGEGSENPTQDLRAAAVDKIAPVLVLTSTDPAELALTASQSFFEQAPVVLLADADDESAQGAAAAAALDLHAPVLLMGGAIADSGLAKEVERLGAVTAVVVTPDRAPNVDAAGVVTAGAAAVPALSSEDLEQEARKSVEAIDPALDAVTLDAGALVATADGGAEIDENDLAEVRDQLPETASPRLLTEVLALVDEAPGQTAALATAQAAGVVPLAVAGGDPRATSASVQAMAKAKALAVVGIGESFGTVDDLTARVRAAETGVELVGGGQLVSEGKRFVVLPSTTVPSTPARVAEMIAKVAARAEPYVEVATVAGDETVTVPTVELVVTEASGAAGKDGNYSTELAVEAVRPAVQAALDAGQQVLLEIQPGRASFVDQVERYADLLALPGVGVSLDLDARRAGGAVKKDGEVPAEEINEVVSYLAGFVEAKTLPQKMLVVHASTPRSVTNLGALATTDDSVVVVVHSDVAGSYAARSKAWDALTAGAPAALRWGRTDLVGEVTPERAATTEQVAPAPLVVVVE